MATTAEAGAESGTWNSIKDFNKWQELKSLGHHYVLPRHISRKLDQEGSSWNLKWYSHVEQGVPQAGLNQLDPIPTSNSAPNDLRKHGFSLSSLSPICKGNYSSFESSSCLHSFQCLNFEISSWVPKKEPPTPRVPSTVEWHQQDPANQARCTTQSIHHVPKC